MKKFTAAILLAALLPLGACTVYGLGPAPNAAWANYDFTAQYGLSGYDRPVVYGGGYGYAGGYGGGYDVGVSYGGGHGGYGVGVDGPGYYGSYYSYGH